MDLSKSDPTLSNSSRTAPRQYTEIGRKTVASGVLCDVHNVVLTYDKPTIGLGQPYASSTAYLSFPIPTPTGNNALTAQVDDNHKCRRVASHSTSAEPMCAVFIWRRLHDPLHEPVEIDGHVHNPLCGKYRNWTSHFQGFCYNCTLNNLERINGQLLLQFDCYRKKT